MHTTINDASSSTIIENKLKLSSQLPPPVRYYSNSDENIINNNVLKNDNRSQSPLPPPLKPSDFLPAAQFSPASYSTFVTDNNNDNKDHHQSPVGSSDNDYQRLRLNSLDALVMNQSVLQPTSLNDNSYSSDISDIDFESDENLFLLSTPPHSSKSLSRSRSKSKSKRSRSSKNTGNSSMSHNNISNNSNNDDTDNNSSNNISNNDSSITHSSSNHDGENHVSSDDSDGFYEADDNDDENDDRVGGGGGIWHNVEDQLIVIINRGSGARKGWILAKELKKFNAIIYDLLELSRDPQIVRQLGKDLELWQNKSLVMICGGDGSIAWAASMIDKALATVQSVTPMPFPPTCTLPLGTGNDLSRSLGWGALEPNHKNIMENVADVQFCAKITKRWSDLDRWRISYTFDHIPDEEEPQLIEFSSDIASQLDSDLSSEEDSPSENPLKTTDHGSIIETEAEERKEVNIDDEDSSDTPNAQPNPNLNYTSFVFPRNGFNMRMKHYQQSTYALPPPKNFFIQQNPKSKLYQHIHQHFDPPLPSSFLCYLSLGYDALVAHKFESERREFPERFNNQFKNQMMYVKHGFTEFFKPSQPLNGNVLVFMNGEEIKLPTNCRSLKLININSAMNGLFFWGSGKSRPGEFQECSNPRLDDGKIELMATRGVHDMIQYRVNVSHAHRIAQPNDVTISVKKNSSCITDRW